MRIATFLCFLACALVAPQLIVAGQPKYGVSVQAVKREALAKARTYVWTVTNPAFDKQVDATIVAAVDRELGARGLTKLPSGRSDVMVTYRSLTRTDVDVKSKAPNNARPEYAVGSLLVDVTDAVDRQSLFRVRMDTPIERDPATVRGAIDGVVAAMFEKYPAASKR